MDTVLYNSLHLIFYNIHYTQRQVYPFFDKVAHTVYVITLNYTRKERHVPTNTLLSIRVCHPWFG